MPTDSTISGEVNSKEPDLESVSIAFTSTQWMNAPTNVVSNIPSLGFCLSYFHDYKLNGNNITLAPGLSFANQVSATNAGFIYHWNAVSHEFDTTTLFPDTSSYTSNRLSQQWIEIPLELRFRTNNNEKGKSFKIAIGAKAGYMIGNHYTHAEKDEDGLISKFKMYHIRNLNPLEYGLTGRIGFGSASLAAYYSLSDFFKSDKGSEVQPLVISLSFSLNTNP